MLSNGFSRRSSSSGGSRAATSPSNSGTRGGPPSDTLSSPPISSASMWTSWSRTAARRRKRPNGRRRRPRSYSSPATPSRKDSSRACRAQEGTSPAWRSSRAISTPSAYSLLKEAAPGVTRLAFLEDQSARGSAPNAARVGENWQSIEATSRHLGIQLTEVLPVRKPDDMDRAFALAARHRTGGVLVLASALFSAQTQRIVSLAAKGRLPAIYEHEGFVDAGGLMSYGPSHPDIFRLIAGY